MTTATIKYTGGLRTEAVHTKSGNQIVTDAPTDNNGKGEAFSPTDLVATALGSCMLTIMGISARNHDIDIEGAAVDIVKTMDSNPRRISKVDVTITMPSKAYSDKDKKIMTAAANGCPVYQSLHPDMEVNLVINWQ